MDINKILSHVDHTLLKQTATWEDIKTVCDDGMKYKTASVCIPPCFVRQAKEYVGDGLKICTVIGFPNGYNTTEVKAFETRDALKNGADEIDMVINIGDLKAKRYAAILEEILTIKSICAHRVLKVIIETCLLTDDEKIKMCELVTEAHADFIKTSTGFSTGGATLEDIELFRGHVADTRIKAAGGIRALDDAEAFLNLGCERLGTSAIVKIIKAENSDK